MAMEGDSRLKLITCSKQGLNSALITIISRSRKSCKICLVHVDKKVPAKIFFFFLLMCNNEHTLLFCCGQHPWFLFYISSQLKLMYINST